MWLWLEIILRLEIVFCVRLKFGKIYPSTAPRILWISTILNEYPRTNQLTIWKGSHKNVIRFFHAQLWQTANSILYLKRHGLAFLFWLTVNAENYAYQHLQQTIFRLHSSSSIELKMNSIAISVIFYGHFPKIQHTHEKCGFEHLHVRVYVLAEPSAMCSSCLCIIRGVYVFYGQHFENQFSLQMVISA